MRLPLVPQLSTKDGVSNKNARLTNCLKETKASGEIAVVRPGLRVLDSVVGEGKGLVAFNDDVISVYAATLINHNYVEFSLRDTLAPASGLWAVVHDETYFYAIEWFITADVYRSSDGVTWQFLSNSPGLGLYLAYSDLVFVSVPVSGFDVLTSVDCVGWSPATLPNTYPFLSNRTGVVGGNGRFCVINTSPRIHTSTDGLSWVESVVEFGNLKSAAYKNGTFCVINTSQSMTSTDGVIWDSTGVTPNPDFTEWRYIAASDDIFCVISSSDYIEFAWLSEDGLIWEAVPIAGKNFISLHWVGSAFCAITLDGEILKSPDGRIWTSKGNTGYVPTGGGGASIYGDIVVFGNTSTESSQIFMEHIETRSLVALSGDFFDFAQSTL